MTGTRYKCNTCGNEASFVLTIAKQETWYYHVDPNDPFKWTEEQVDEGHNDGTVSAVRCTCGSDDVNRIEVYPV